MPDVDYTLVGPERFLTDAEYLLRPLAAYILGYDCYGFQLDEDAPNYGHGIVVDDRENDAIHVQRTLRAVLRRDNSAGEGHSAPHFRDDQGFTCAVPGVLE